MNATHVKTAVESRPGAPLGVLVWWGQYLAKVRPADLRALLVAEGVDPGILPAKPTPDRAFRRAAMAVQGLAPDSDETEEETLRVRRVFRDDVEVTYGLQEPVYDKAGRREDWRQFAKVSWFPATGRVVSDWPEHPAVRRMMELLPEFRENYITADVNRAIGRMMARLRAIPMVTVEASDGKKRRAAVNSRFVPGEAGAEQIRALARALRQVPGCGIDLVTVPDDDESRASMAKSAERGLEAEVSAAEAELAEFRAKLGEGGLVRSATLLDRVERLAEIEERAGRLADLLRFRADGIVARVEEASNQLAALAAAP